MCNNAEFIYDGDLVDNFLPSSFVTGNGEKQED
jgi:hypothetical protein